MEEEKKREIGKKRKILTRIGIVILVLVIAALAAIIYWLLNKEEEPEKRLPSEGLVVDPEDANEAAPMFTTDMNMVWTFSSGNRTSNDAVIGNSADNTCDVYFEVYLDDDDETLLYSSPILPIGKRLDKLKLDKALPDGVHEAHCTFHLLDQEDHDRELSTVTFDVTLIFMPGEGVSTES